MPTCKTCNDYHFTCNGKCPCREKDFDCPDIPATIHHKHDWQPCECQKKTEKPSVDDFTAKKLSEDIEKADEIFQTIRRLGNGRYDSDDANYCVELIANAIREAYEDGEMKGNLD